MRSPSTAPAGGLASALTGDTACSIALAAAVAASAQPTSPAPAGDARPAKHDAVLIALGAEMDRREADLVAMRAVVYPDIEEKNVAAWAAYRAADNAQEAFIRDRIASQRATTPAGIAVKARSLTYLSHPESWMRCELENTPVGAVIASLVDDIGSVASPAPHPDAELLRLALDITDAAQRVDELSNKAFKVEEERFREPPVPEALIWRGSDHRVIGYDASHLDRMTIEGKKRDAYTPRSALDDLRKALATQEARGSDGSAYDVDRTYRLRELVAAAEAWHAERDAAYEAVGLAELDRLYDEQTERRDALALEIAVIPARTPEGVCAKVRAMTAVESWSLEALSDGSLAKRIAETAKRDDYGRALLLSVIVDAAKVLAEASTASAAA